jgi:hypothetical protein
MPCLFIPSRHAALHAFATESCGPRWMALTLPVQLLTITNGGSYSLLVQGADEGADSSAVLLLDWQTVGAEGNETLACCFLPCTCNLCVHGARPCSCMAWVALLSC